MLTRVAIVLVLLGLVARLFVLDAHERPRGDVLLEVGVASALADGDGFGAGFERGTFFDLRGTGPRGAGRADQHPPLWPLIGAVLGVFTGSAFAGLQIGSLLFGIVLILLVLRETDRLVEGVVGAPDGLPMLAAAVVAASFVAIDASGNGSLYAAQACGVVLLVRLLAAERVSVLGLGALLGALLLLNYQNAVLLAAPLVVAALVPGEEGRGRTLARALGALAVAAAVQVPWLWRNASVFGHPLYSTNGAYFAFSAGVEPVFTIEQGVPVLRFAHELSLVEAARAVVGWLGPNLLYVAATGVVVWAGVLGVVAAGVGPALARGLRQRDRRLVALVVTLALLLAVVLLWPRAKLRFFVPMLAPVVMLGMRVLAAPPTRGERRLGWLVAAGWIALAVLTLDDLGDSPDARPERWRLLAVGGAGFVLVPLLVRMFGWGGESFRLAVTSGVGFAPVLTAVALLPPAPMPSTTYHSSMLTPDLFGRFSEFEKDVEARTVARAAEIVRERGGERVIGPVMLLGAGVRDFVSLPAGHAVPEGSDALAALVDGRDVDHVITRALEQWRGHHLLLDAGDRWLDGRLEVVELVSPNVEVPIVGVVVSRVVPEGER